MEKLMPISELIFDMVKKYPGYSVTIGYNEKHDWHEVYITYGASHISRCIPTWVTEMYSVNTVMRTIQTAFEELAATFKGEAR